MMDEEKIKLIIEGLLLAAGKTLTIDHMLEIFEEHERPDVSVLKSALKSIEEDCVKRGFELKKVASGYRFQVRQELGEWISRLWEEKPPKYSRAFLETLSIMAYRQPITRGDIEKIRGVAVSSTIVRTLLDRDWIRVVGHRDVPGRPAMYATTRQFLDYFNLESLEQLPALTEIRDIEEINKGLSLDEEKPVIRVLDMPTEEQELAEIFDDSELIDEAEAVELSSKHLGEILGIEIEEDSEEDIEEDSEEDSENQSEPESLEENPPT